MTKFLFIFVCLIGYSYGQRSLPIQADDKTIVVVISDSVTTLIPSRSEQQVIKIDYKELDDQLRKLNFEISEFKSTFDMKRYTYKRTK